MEFINLSESDKRSLIERLTGIDQTTLPEIETVVSFDRSAQNTLIGVAGIFSVSIIIAALIKSK